jgi:predicted DNA-binding transcriptional regulator AlpA
VRYSPAMNSEKRDSNLQLLSEPATARALQISRATLRAWRSRGAGPPWLRVGPRLVRYDVAALRQWIEERAGARAGQSG